MRGHKIFCGTLPIRRCDSHHQDCMKHCSEHCFIVFSLLFLFVNLIYLFSYQVAVFGGHLLYGKYVSVHKRKLGKCERIYVWPTIHQTRCRYSAVRGAEKQGQSSAWKQNWQLEVRPDPLNCLSLRFDYKDRAMDFGNFCKNFCKSGKSSEKAPNFLLDMAGWMVDLRSYLSALKVNNLIYTPCQEAFELEMRREYLSSAADGNMITNFAWKRCLVRAEFDGKLINAGRDVLYEKLSIEALPRQLDSGNSRGDVYFWPRSNQDVDGAAHHALESKYSCSYRMEGNRSDVFCKLWVVCN